MARIRIVLFAVCLLVLIAAPAGALDPGHGPAKGGEGRDLLDPHVASGPASPGIADNFEVVGHSNLGGGVPNGDVFVYDHGGSVGTYAYVGTWSAQCTGQGAKIVDVNDPTRPKWVGYVGARKDSSNEDVVVARIGSRDVLGIGVQACGRRGSAGLALFDVTDPRNPVELSFLPTVSGGVHELDLVVRDDGQALALLAVPFAEFTFDEEGNPTPVGEFQIANISDPEHPELITDWRLYEQGLRMHDDSHEITSPFQGEGLFPVMFGHSARAADGGYTAYVSHWDAGVVKVDITDASSPVTIGHTVYPEGSDGDAHSMTPYDAGGNRYILQNDEDFDSFHSTAVGTSSATGSRDFSAIQERWAPTLLADTGPISGTIHDAGDGCDPSDYAGAEGKIALADSVDPFYNPPPCAIGDQALMAADAGAIAFVSNLLSIDDAWGFGPDTDADLSPLEGMPLLQISDIDGVAAAIRAAGGPVTMSLDPSTPGWGFLRVFREVPGENWEEVGRFEGPAVNADGSPFFPPGSWSIHNTEVLGDRGYVSWYSAGIIALDLSDPTHPELVGQFVPKTSKRHANSLGPGPAEVWGVAIDPDTGLIYASDMRTGLWIVRPTGDAAA
jgi:hypothetical protein